MRLKHRNNRRGVRLPARFRAADNPRRIFELILQQSLRDAAKEEPFLLAVELAYDDVPGSDPTEWEDHEPPLCRAFRRNRFSGEADRIVFYRFPLQHAHPDARTLSRAIRTLALAQARALQDAANS